MKNMIRCLAKLTVALAAVGAVVCVVAAYWDRIVDAFYAIADRVEEKKADGYFCACESGDFDDDSL